jgi:tetratricopeptide (TPR) repeat protein
VNAGDIARLAKTALDHGTEDQAAPTVEQAVRKGSDPRLWQWLALLHRSLDQRSRALPAIRRAADLAPNDPKIAHAHARIRLEAGLPARAAFDVAHRLAPSDGDVLLGRCAARAAEGDAPGAADELTALLTANPGWLAGHADLAHLRWTLGQRERFGDSYRASLTAAPRHEPMWHAYVMLLVQAGLYREADGAIASARALLGDQPFLLANAAVVASETGAADTADTLFAHLAEVGGIDLAVRRVRHLLRTGRLPPALIEAERWMTHSEAALMWPYLAVAWRLANDPRYEWLEGRPELVQVVDLADRLPADGRLASVLHSLHTASAQQFDQSVRGGTQTEGALFARVEPEIAQVRAMVVDAVEQYRAKLPPRESGHPTLAARRDERVRFRGSWSVRLRGAGHHANHVHPAGWLSSALYVALPEDMTDRAGWLTLGQPQDELGLGLEPVRLIEPRPGRLVLFPSTMWHGTLPFARGERLTIAFDVAPPISST